MEGELVNLSVFVKRERLIKKQGVALLEGTNGTEGRSGKGKCEMGCGDDVIVLRLRTRHHHGCLAFA